MSACGSPRPSSQFIKSFIYSLPVDLESIGTINEAIYVNVNGQLGYQADQGHFALSALHSHPIVK